MALHTAPLDPILTIEKATLQFGSRTIWSDLSLTVQPGEFIAILGPNGTGKTTLLRTILGLNQLTSGTVAIQGRPPQRGNSGIGYIPQQKAFDKDLPLRGRDLVHLGYDGHRFGFVRHNNKIVQRIRKVVEEVGATAYIDKPIGRLSGGEQQRLRIAQSLLGEPRLLLCDEPLLSLDLKSQQLISELIDSYKQHLNMGVLFVTHDINPILDMVDRVLYLVNGKWAIGTPKEVLTTDSLSRLYGTPVDVITVRGRIIVVNASENQGVGNHHHIPNDNKVKTNRSAL